jgi:UDP-N-acetylmuramoyl-L-alanyl-D-glutamate--2,6-diaminopimelate ligase
VRLDGLIDEAGLAPLGLLVDTVGDLSADVTEVTMDSRRVTAGCLFACVPGSSVDGHRFGPAAVAEGASALLCERLLDVDAPQVIVASVRRALGPVCDVAYGRPSRDLLIAAVTGTNGKTTVCGFLQAVFDANGWPATAVGTLTQRRTTPEAPDLQALLAEWRQAGGRAVAMEVSSHALDQHRTDAVRFAAGVFTNLSPEHLDYHHTMQSYFECKAGLFDPGRVGVSVVNSGDPWGARLAERVRAAGEPLVTFSRADAEDVVLSPAGATFRWKGQPVAIRLGGVFNVENALAAAACAEAVGVPGPVIAEGLARVESVAGRFQRVDAGQPFTVVVDYAHTPDGLEKVLDAARQIGTGRVLVVFGAGGDRDREKRPLMGSVAARRADLVLVTSDNPRSEDPDSIIAQVVAGAGDADHVRSEVDRASAIATALATAAAGDVVVIAGKGHERSQEIGGRTLPFDDVEVATTALTRIMESRQGGGR